MSHRRGWSNQVRFVTDMESMLQLLSLIQELTVNQAFFRRICHLRMAVIVYLNATFRLNALEILVDGLGY